MPFWGVITPPKRCSISCYEALYVSTSFVIKEKYMIIKKREPYPSIQNYFLEREDNLTEYSVTYSFFEGATPCRHLILDSIIAQKVAAYSLIQKDLISAYNGIKHLVELQTKSIQNGLAVTENESTQFIVQKSLHQAAVITYGKCFADASGGKIKSKNKPRGVKLDRNIIKDFSLSQRQAHDYLIQTRNDYVVHGGATNLEQSLCFVVVSPNSKIISNVLTMEAHTATASIELLKTILELISNIQKSLKVMQNKKSEVITRVELPKFTDEEIKINSVGFLKLFNLS